MYRARGCDLRAVLAGVIVCWAVTDGVASAQEGAEVTESLGNSYTLARRTTGQGSIIETLLYGGRAIVTELVVPGSDRAVSAGTLLSGEVAGDYLILHLTPAGGPASHEIFRDGEMLGAITEVDRPVAAPPPGRDAFAFESVGGHFLVHLTLRDGTVIHATSERGRLVGQVVEGAAAGATAPTIALSAPAVTPQLAPAYEMAKPAVTSLPEVREPAWRPQPPADRVREELAPSFVTLPPPRTVATPPRLRPRPTIAAAPARTGSSPPLGFFGNAPRTTTMAPAVPAAQPKPTVATV
jgi:hypothetical protein